MEKKSSTLSNFLKGIISENPIFVSLLGMCPTLATTKSVEAAIGMGILVLLVLIGSNVVISLLRHVIPQQIKIPAYIVIIASFVTIIKMLCQAFLPELFDSLGVFISLIVVNCIILGRAEAYASKNKVFDSFIDAVGMGIGFTMALMIIAFFREVLGTGGIEFGVYLSFLPQVTFRPLSSIAVNIFVQSPGGFIVLGCVLAFIAWRRNVKNDRLAKEQKEKLALEKANKAVKEAA